MIKIDVRHNLQGIALSYKRLAEDLRDKAMVRALNKTATTVRAEAAREIRKEYNLKIGAIKDQIQIIRATGSKLTAIVRASGRPIPLIQFDARWSRTMAGASVRVKKTRKTVRGAFIAKMKSGHIGVFTRTQKSGAVAKRSPIRQLFSLSLPAAFTQRTVADALVKVAKERFPVVLEQEARFALRRA